MTVNNAARLPPLALRVPIVLFFRVPYDEYDSTRTRTRPSCCAVVYDQEGATTCYDYRFGASSESLNTSAATECAFLQNNKRAPSLRLQSFLRGAAVVSTAMRRLFVGATALGAAHGTLCAASLAQSCFTEGSVGESSAAAPPTGDSGATGNRLRTAHNPNQQARSLHFPCKLRNHAPIAVSCMRMHAHVASAVSYLYPL